MIRYTVHLPHQPPVDLKLSALADQKILEAAPAIIAANHDDPKRELSLYLGLYEGPEAHPLLWRIVYSGGSAADQARHALLFHPQSDELPKLAAQLMQPGNSDPYGMNLASLPKGLIVAFGDKAVPVLEAAVRDSPYVWVRTNSAAELLRKNDPAAFRFFLDAIVNNRWSANVAYKGQLLQHVKEAFPAELSNAASQKAVADFLRARLRQETGGFCSSRVYGEIMKLASLVRADGTMSLAVRVKRGFDQVRLVIEADPVNLLNRVVYLLSSHRSCWERYTGFR
jgi:hypothetical protein